MYQGSHLLNECMIIVSQMVDNLLSVASRLYDGLGIFPIIFSVFMIAVVVRFILKPIFGGPGSDKVKKKKVGE